MQRCVSGGPGAGSAAASGEGREGGGPGRGANLGAAPSSPGPGRAAVPRAAAGLWEAGPAGLGSAVLPGGRRRPRALRPRGAVRGGAQPKKRSASVAPRPGAALPCAEPSRRSPCRSAGSAGRPFLGRSVGEGRLPIGAVSRLSPRC